MMIHKNIRPIQLDINLKYQCPNTNCDNYHWLSIKEVRVKNFKVVCDCGTIFNPKQIDKLKLSYSKFSKTKTLNSDSPELPIDLRDKCVTILVDYGFTRKEAIDLITKTFKLNNSTDVGFLIKQTLLSLGEKDEC